MHSLATAKAQHETTKVQQATTISEVVATTSW
jgi:hypothetical protein